MSRDLTVVGGLYVEDCAFPRSTTYRGSGLRAANVLASLRNKVTLHSAAGSDQMNEFHRIAAMRGIELKTTQVPSTTWFRYRHPLSRPDIFPPPSSVSVQWDTVETSDALVFGMMEGRPKVLADRVVYDPQDGYRARAYDADGSQARELAIVASYSEGAALTGKRTPKDIVSGLLRFPMCSVSVLKCGPQGALVATRSTQGWVRPIPSEKVWKIGSGDVFSAAFAHAWLKEAANPIEAAWFASSMVSHYVSTREEYCTKPAIDRIRGAAQNAKSRTSANPVKLPEKHVYLAAPFFTTSEQWMVDEARGAFLDMGFKVFSPIHDVGEGPSNEVAPADLHGLEQSGLVFALLDGLDPGTLFEVGYARACQIPVVGVSVPVMERSMTMLQGSGCSVFDDFTTAVYVACWKLMGDV